MNSATEAVLEFLDSPATDLGASPLDVEMVQDPALTRDLTVRLLEGPLPSGEGRAAADALRARLDEIDWPAVSAAMRGRLRLTDALLDTSAEDAAKTAS